MRSSRFLLLMGIVLAGVVADAGPLAAAESLVRLPPPPSITLTRQAGATSSPGTAPRTSTVGETSIPIPEPLEREPAANAGQADGLPPMPSAGVTVQEGWLSLPAKPAKTGAASKAPSPSQPVPPPSGPILQPAPTSPWAPPLAAQGYLNDQLTMLFFDGPVYYCHRGESEWKQVSKGQIFIDGDAVRTGRLGYAVLAFSHDNLVVLKPHGGVRFSISAGPDPRLQVQIHKAALLISVRDSDRVELAGAHGTFFLSRGEATYHGDGKAETIRSLNGTTLCRLRGGAQPISIPEAYGIEIDHSGRESAPTGFDVRMEYDEFRRFKTWLENFDSANRQVTTQVTYKIDNVMINDRFLSHLETDREGYWIIDPGHNPAPKLIHLKVKLTPYPRPDDRFEIYLNKDLVYPLQEGRDGFYEARIPTPSFPEFHLKIHVVDAKERRDRIFEGRFVIYNRHRKIEEVKAFLGQLSLAFSRRDLIFLRDHISREYRDWFGNTYWDFTRILDDTLRQYRDVRLNLHPHTFVFKGAQVQVAMNYRLSLLTGNWNYRWDDHGSELMTLEFSDGEWRIRSKAKGMFLQRMRTAMDLRLGILKGRVSDEATGRPIVGAGVRLLNTRFNTQTDSLGEYVFYHVPPGKYDIEITRNGYGKITITKVEVVPTGERF